MDPLAGLLLVGLSVLSTGAIGYAVWRGQQRTAALKAAVASHGWRWVDAPGAVRIEGGTEVPWVLEQTTGRGRGGSGPRPPRWTAPAAPTEQAVLVGPVGDLPRTAAVFEGGLALMLMRLVLGARADELVGARVVPEVGSEAFRARFAVVATDEAAARTLVTPEVEQALLTSALQRVAVLRWHDEVQVLSLGDRLSAEAAVAQVALGERVASACGY